MTQENTTVGDYARKERDRLTQLTGGSVPPASGTTTPTKPQ
jgi:hypothetical protein